MKSLKIVGIVMIVTVVAISGGLALYFFIQKNKTYYIYDVRIVEPIAGAYTYIYTDSEREYTNLRNKVVYMTNSNANKFEIGIYASTSTNTRDIELTSSDSSVASVYSSGGHCFVSYQKAGEADITASVGGMSDTIHLKVYDNVAEDFSVYDDAYYGEFCEQFPNKIVCYADDNFYSYNYKASCLLNGDDSMAVNDDHLRIDLSKVDNDIFTSVRVDSENKSITLRCKSTRKVIDENGNEIVEKITDSIDTTIVVQSYYIVNSETKEIKVENNYLVSVHIVADTPEYMQVLMSTTPDFNDGSVYVYTEDLSSVNIAENLDDTDLLEESLSNQKEVKYLYEENELEFYKAFFTNKVSKIYIRFRKIYTNGKIVYLNPLNYDNNMFKITTYWESTDGIKTKIADSEKGSISDGFLEIARNENYYVLTLNKKNFTDNANSKYLISLQLEDFNLDIKDFYFDYRDLVKDNLLDFYTYDETTQTYSYSYWDPRSHFDYEVYDAQGVIIDFGALK